MLLKRPHVENMGSFSKKFLNVKFDEILDCHRYCRCQSDHSKALWCFLFAVKCSVFGVVYFRETGTLLLVRMQNYAHKITLLVSLR